MSVVNMGDVAAAEWWAALERLVGALEPDCAGAPPPAEKLNEALDELRRHGRRGRPQKNLWRSTHAQTGHPTVMSGTISSMSYVYDGREAIGFVLARGRAGYEALDREQRSLGLFKTAAAAANVVFNAAASERP